jgi:hypothetical protein
MSDTDDDLGYKKIHDKSQGHEVADDELDGQRIYDDKVIKIIHEGKAMYVVPFYSAVQAIKDYTDKARIDELESICGFSDVGGVRTLIGVPKGQNTVSINDRLIQLKGDK